MEGSEGHRANWKDGGGCRGGGGSSDEYAESSSEDREGWWVDWSWLMCERKALTKEEHTGGAYSCHCLICFWSNSGGGLPKDIRTWSRGEREEKRGTSSRRETLSKSCARCSRTVFVAGHERIQ